MNRQISELRAGEAIERFKVLIEKCAEALTKNGKPYLKLTVRDKSSSIKARMWGNNAPLPQIKEGCVCEVSAQVEEFAGSLQLNIQAMSPTDESPDQFAKWSEFPVEKMWGELVNVVGEMKEPLTKFVAEELLLKQEAVVAAFKRAPAARGVHNAWYAGLLEHVWSMIDLAQGVVARYKQYVPLLSWDKVAFGVLLHDLGKTLEYDFSTPAFKTAPLGSLTNHLVAGPCWVYEQANRFPSKGEMPNFKMERAHLVHILAAHHGQLDWGSPMKPASLEAIIVHQLDKLDSSMMHAVELVRGKAGQMEGFSEKSYIEHVSYLQPKA